LGSSAAQAVPAAAVNRAIWVANAIHSVDQSRSFAQSELVGYLVAAYQKNPSLSADDAVKLINSARRAVATANPSSDLYDVTSSAFTVLGTDSQFSYLTHHPRRGLLTSSNPVDRGLRVCHKSS